MTAFEISRLPIGASVRRLPRLLPQVVACTTIATIATQPTKNSTALLGDILDLSVIRLICDLQSGESGSSIRVRGLCRKALGDSQRASLLKKKLYRLRYVSLAQIKLPRLRGCRE